MPTDKNHTWKMVKILLLPMGHQENAFENMLLKVVLSIRKNAVLLKWIVFSNTRTLGVLKQKSPSSLIFVSTEGFPLQSSRICIVPHFKLLEDITSIARSDRTKWALLAGLQTVSSHVLFTIIQIVNSTEHHVIAKVSSFKPSGFWTKNEPRVTKNHNIFHT